MVIPTSGRFRYVAVYVFEFRYSKLTIARFALFFVE